MTAGFKLIDSAGSKAGTTVSGGALHTVEHPAPPFGLAQNMQIFRQFLTADGTSTGSTDMRVDGSVTNVNFWIPAQQSSDLYIKRISFVLADASLSLAKFGNLTALTNGCTLKYSDKRGDVTIHGALKTSFDLVRLCVGGEVPIGATTSSFIASNVAGTSEGIIPSLDFSMVFGFRWGLRLAYGTAQKLVVSIRDDISSGLDQFDCIGYGFTLSS